MYWFILQHLRGYKPFLTKIKLKKNLKIGKIEIENSRVEREKDTEIEKYKRWVEFNKGSKF